jgi:DNA-binding protein H-NS
MWKSLIELLGKGIDLIRDLVTRKQARAAEAEAERIAAEAEAERIATSQAEQLGRASGAAAYDASKRAGRPKP